MLSGCAIISLTIFLLKISCPEFPAPVYNSVHAYWVWGWWNGKWMDFFPSQASSVLPCKDGKAQQNLGQTFCRLSGFESVKRPTVTTWVQGSILTLAETAERCHLNGLLVSDLLTLRTNVLSVVSKQVVLVSLRPKKSQVFHTDMSLNTSEKEIYSEIHLQSRQDFKRTVRL